MTGPEIDRRVTLQWMLGAMAVGAAPVQSAYAAVPTSPWPSVNPDPVKGPGYGTDPKLLEPVVPWPKTLTAVQLATAAALCDTILPAEGKYPAPSAIGIHQFVDEWVSAPYPQQVADRAVILNGFAWLEAEAQSRYGSRYAQLDETKRSLILADAAKADARGKAFLDRMKFLTTGAYFTSEQGIEELGYVGNTPITDGDYPGPTKEALAHLDGVLAALNLKRK
ncbi:MAG: gluconate 2-dehydrogenase subunit 3 family protein [Sphingomicrobium sp.]